MNSSFILFTFRMVLCFILFGNFSECKKNNATRVENDKESGSTITLRKYSRDSIDENGVLKWKLFSEDTYYFNKEAKTIMYGVYVEQYEKNKVKTKLKADRGVMLQNENLMMVEGNIVLNTVDGKQLEAEELVYNTSDEVMRSDKRVVIRTQGTVIRGIGLEADKSLDKYKILKPEAITVSGNPLQRE